MKKSILVLAGLVVAILACSPSQRAVETAMAQTLAAMPTATATPLPTSTSTPPPTATRTRTATPVPVPTQRPVTIEEITALLRDDGFIVYDLLADPETGQNGYRYYTEGLFIAVWLRDDNANYDSIQVLFLHDPQPSVRLEYAHRGIEALRGILPDEAIAQLTTYSDEYNRNPYGEMYEQITLGGAVAYDSWVYTYQETSTCPPEYEWCYYTTWPTITFTGTASLTFYIIAVAPVE